jgi:hypothetical protein
MVVANVPAGRRRSVGSRDYSNQGCLCWNAWQRDHDGIQGKEHNTALHGQFLGSSRHHEGTVHGMQLGFSK